MFAPRAGGTAQRPFRIIIHILAPALPPPIPPAIGLHSFACLCRSLNGCCCPSPAVVGQISANLREAHKSSVHHIPSSFQGPAPFPAPRRNVKKQTDKQPPALLHQLPFHSFICILSREFVLSSSKTVRNNAATTKTAVSQSCPTFVLFRKSSLFSYLHDLPLLFS